LPFRRKKPSNKAQGLSVQARDRNSATEAPLLAFAGAES
jgi:hypothetical protein